MSAATNLAALEGVITQLLAGGAVQHITLRDGRSTRHYDIPQLIALKRELEGDVAAEQAAQSSAGDGTTFVQFGSPK